MLASPVVIVQIIAAVILLGGLIHVVLNQLTIKHDIRAIKHQIGARP